MRRLSWLGYVGDLIADLKMQIANFSEWRLQDFRNWSARGDLHSQGCLILSQVGLLFPVNHAPVLIANCKLQTGLPDFGEFEICIMQCAIEIGAPGRTLTRKLSVRSGA